MSEDSGNAVEIAKALLVPENLPENADVRFMHFRPQKGVSKSVAKKLQLRYERSRPEFVPATKGGRTVCAITLGDDTGATAYFGEAVCGPKDNFSYRLGREIAFGRALKKYREARALMLTVSVVTDDVKEDAGAASDNN